MYDGNFETVLKETETKYQEKKKFYILSIIVTISVVMLIASTIFGLHKLFIISSILTLVFISLIFYMIISKLTKTDRHLDIISEIPMIGIYVISMAVISGLLLWKTPMPLYYNILAVGLFGITAPSFLYFAGRNDLL